MPNDTTQTDGIQDPATPVNEVMLVDLLQDIDQEIADLKGQIELIQERLSTVEGNPTPPETIGEKKKIIGSYAARRAEKKSKKT